MTEIILREHPRRPPMTIKSLIEKLTFLGHQNGSGTEVVISEMDGTLLEIDEVEIKYDGKECLVVLR